MILLPQLLLLVFTITTSLSGRRIMAWHGTIAVIIGFVLSVITALSVVIADYCVCLTAAANTQDQEMMKGQA